MILFNPVVLILLFVYILGFHLSKGPLHIRVSWPIVLLYVLYEWKHGRARLLPPWRKQ